MTVIKSVVFDVGAVLIDWDPRHLYRKLMSETDMDVFLRDICPFEWNAEMDLRNDKSWRDHAEERARMFPDHAEHIRFYFSRWPEMVSGTIDGTVRIKDTLRTSGVPLYAITNFSADNWKVAQDLWPTLTDFDGVIVSGEEGIVKPDPAIYHLLYDRYGLDPAELLFIDDRMENIEAAEQTGMKGHVFTDPANLAQTLSQYFDLKLAA